MNDLKYTKFILPNGLKCILYKRAEIHSINIEVSVGVGSLDEESSVNGIAHLIEHLAFDGTEKLPTYNDIDRFSNSIAGSGNAYTSNTHTVYHGTYPYQYLDEALSYYSQLVFHPTHKEEFIKKEKTIVLDEMKRYEDMVNTKVHMNIIENRFTDSSTSFSAPIVGTTKIVKSLIREQVRQFYDQYYVPENIEILIVGNFNLPDLKKCLLKYFYTEVKDRKFAKAPKRVFQEVYPEYSNFNISAKQKLDLDQYYLTFTFPSLEFLFNKQRGRLVIDFLDDNTASGQFQQSVLWKTLREELGIVYGVSAWRSGLFSRSYNCIQTSFAPEHLETVISEVYKGLNQIKEGKISDEIFKMIKKQVNDTQLMELDSPRRALAWIEQQELELKYHKDFLYPEEYLKLINKFKFSEVIDMANKIYDWNKVNIGIVSQKDPKKMEAEVAQIWQKVTKAKSKKSK